MLQPPKGRKDDFSGMRKQSVAYTGERGGISSHSDRKTFLEKEGKKGKEEGCRSFNRAEKVVKRESSPKKERQVWGIWRENADIFLHFEKKEEPSIQGKERFWRDNKGQLAFIRERGPDFQ